MRKVKLLTSMVGNLLKDGKVFGTFSHSKGDEIMMALDEAQKYIDRGYAVAVAQIK